MTHRGRPYLELSILDPDLPGNDVSGHEGQQSQERQADDPALQGLPQGQFEHVIRQVDAVNGIGFPVRPGVPKSQQFVPSPRKSGGKKETQHPGNDVGQTLKAISRQGFAANLRRLAFLGPARGPQGWNLSNQVVEIPPEVQGSHGKDEKEEHHLGAPNGPEYTLVSQLSHPKIFHKELRGKEKDRKEYPEHPQ